MIAPEGDDINDIEVYAEFVGVTGKVDPRFPPIPVKEKTQHVEQTNDAGKPSESHSDESIGDPQHPEDSHPADAGVEGDADAGRVSEAADEQAANTEPAASETETEAVGTESHHKPRRPKHA